MKSGDILVRGDKSTETIGVPEARGLSALCLKLTFILAMALLLIAGGSRLASQVNMQICPHWEAMLLLAVIAYILLMAIPFMPAIEVGLGLMLLMGSMGAVVAYVCTLIALSISFVIGRFLPPRLVCRFFQWLHLFKACELVAELETLSHQERLELLRARAPSKLTPFLLRHRYLAIAIALNLPGNALIGGGGGIGFIAGMSMIVKFRMYIAVLALAIAPLPLSFFLYGN
jgi:hypothetical protein